ncbi:hypothetical protein DKX38_017715 [Salix brachista]|uniref:Thioredoxin domain-containing protein n=1 Tax=Salix brachista TaxID=2182728 RepID=A0A5N5KW11_9ROSI|nr:hypothetical protein DKX38_017715 [Salix brachista]
MATVPEPHTVPSCSSAILPKHTTTLANALASTIYRRSLHFPQLTGLKTRSQSSSTVNRSLVLCLRLLVRRGNHLCWNRKALFWWTSGHHVPAVTDATWKSLVLESESPVLVDFWAPWCGPCRMIHPVINELANQYAGKLKCYKLTTDDCSSIATQYGIRSIPTVIIFKNGEKKEAIIGAVPKTTFTTSIEKFL